MATTTETCVYKTVTLAVGESFTLPANSTVIAAEDPSGISSECADLSNLETLDCYVSIIALAGNYGSPSIFWQVDNGSIGGSVALTGFAVKQSLSADEVVTNFDSPYGFADGYGIVPSTAALKAELTAKLPGAVARKVEWDNGGNSGPLFYIVISAPASVAENLYLVLASIDRKVLVKFYKSDSAYITAEIPTGISCT